MMNTRPEEIGAAARVRNFTRACSIWVKWPCGFIPAGSGGGAHHVPLEKALIPREFASVAVRPPLVLPPILQIVHDRPLLVAFREGARATPSKTDARCLGDCQGLRLVGLRQREGCQQSQPGWARFGAETRNQARG